MKSWLRIPLSLNSLRKALGYGTFFSAIKQDYHIELLDSLPSGKILVIAPHPDDDIFGAGGTLAKASPGEVVVAYLCDGSGGVKEGRDEAGQVQRRDPRLIEARRAEAKAAGEILGYKEQIFFGYPDGKLASGSAANQAMVDLIQRVKPDIIFVPSFLDNHPDHRVANEILVNALSSRDVDFNGEIWAYEIWTPIWPNRIIKINDAIELKKKAIATQKSQLQTRGYEKAILGLNQFRAEINNLDGFAEGFFACQAKVYEKLYRKS